MYHSKKYIKGGSWYQTNKPVKADLSLDQTIKDVASTISPASLPSATSLTGAELAVVNQNGENVQTTTQDIADLVAPAYKVYTALLTQTGVSAPIATILQNTLDDVPTYSYSGTGTYEITIGTGIDNTKTVVIFPNIVNTLMAVDARKLIVGAYDAITIGKFTIRTVTNLATGATSDGILLNTPIEIRVYP